MHRREPPLPPRSAPRVRVVSLGRGLHPQRAGASPAPPRLSRLVVALRVAAIAGLFASALLTADVVRGGRGFCPLEEACSKARESALGHVLGVPTAFVGLAAFAALLVLTVSKARFAGLLRPAGVLAGVMGAALLGYQALWLGSFCPFCVVADSAGIAAGALVVAGWGSLRHSPWDGRRSRALWALVAGLIAAGPMLWPRAAEPAWIPVPAAAWRPDDAPPVQPIARVDPPTSPPPRGAPAAPPLGDGFPPAAGAAPAAEEPAVPLRVEIAIDPPEAPPPAPGSPDRGDRAAERTALSNSPPAVEPPPAPAALTPAPDPDPAPAPTPTRTAPPAPAPAAVTPHATPPAAPARAPVATPVRPLPARAAAPDVVLVEYVNAFCPHCRATHACLERVLTGAKVRRHRVYAWGGTAEPLWAQACVCAAAFGKEDALFEELLRADDECPDAIWAAASRVGIDARALWSAVTRCDAAQRLEADRRRADASQVHRLPTIDVGARRLEGESSEADLRAAIQAATVAPSPGK